MTQIFATEAHGIEKVSIVLLFIFLLACAIGILIFEVVMFVDALQNQTLSPGRKAVWLIGMLLAHPFVAIAYYFLVYKKR